MISLNSFVKCKHEGIKEALRTVNQSAQLINHGIQPVNQLYNLVCVGMFLTYFSMNTFLPIFQVGHHPFILASVRIRSYILGVSKNCRETSGEY